ncbi:MAG TPA: DUF6600 domain-containing protein [Steroidobacteraceae bacterium]
MKLSAHPRASLLAITAILMALGFVPALSTPSCARDAAQEPPGRVGRLALIDGTVSYHTADQNYWQRARRNYPVTTGQSFWTEPNSHAAIDIATNRVYLDGSTELDISALDDATAQFSLPEGAVLLVLDALAQGSPFQVQMARAAVTVSTAGRYELIAGDTEHASQVTVFNGSAHVSGNGFELDVHAGETAVISGAESIHAEVRAAGAADAFVAWVEAQERPHRRHAPAVASAMTGAAELAAYGAWARAAGYGDIWYPDVPAGWAPYREGYWAWVEPWGWSWIDEEAWGFAPFHYGRWRMIDDRWAWIPGNEADEPVDAIYAPALVTFFTVADTCAWVPLGPDEAYVPPYPVPLRYFHRINAPFVRDIRTRDRIATEKTTISAYANQHALTAVRRSVMSDSLPVAAHARPISAARLADARPATVPVRPGATTAGVSPVVAHRLGIATGALAAAHAPGPPIRAVAPAANARLAAPLALAPAAAQHATPSGAQHATSSAPQPARQAPALAQPGTAHHLPGSPVGQGGAARENRGGQAAPPSINAARPAPAPLARTAPTAHPAPSPETAGRAAPSTAPSRPVPPPVVHAPQTPAPHAATPPATLGRAAPPPPRAATPHVATPPPVVHTPSPPAVHAPPPSTVGRAPPPHAAIAPPPRPVAPPVVHTPAPVAHAAPPVVHAPPPVAHAAPPATVGRAPPPPAVHAPAPAAPGRPHPGH